MADPVIDEIKQRIDIADLVSQTVQLKKAGRGFKGLCPFHQEKTPSFHVYPDQGTFHCFGCSKSGDAFTWLQETEHLDFGEALRRLADRAGVRLPERTAPKPDPQAQASADALADAAAWFHAQLLRAPDAEAARQYLQRRGVKRETAERFGLGWAPDRWDALTGHLRAKGLTPQQIEEAGLALSGERGLHDRFRGRVMFPIRNPDGTVTGFGGRTLGDGQPKYLNSPQTATFDKSATLYALDLAKPGIRKDGCAVIVEGYMDVVLPHQEGFANVVASLGTALTERQIDLLRRYTGTIVLALDADAAGQAATLRGLEVARQALAEKRRPVPGRATRTGYLQLSAGQIKIAVLQGGKDPDEIVREDPQAWQRLIDSAVPMMDHKVEVELGRVDRSDPQSQAGAVQELARFLVQVPDPIEWDYYVNNIAQRLRLDVRAVRDEVDRAARALRAEQRRQEQAAQQRQAAQRSAASNQRSSESEQEIVSGSLG
ncbi:MAG: DNA primase, partial [Chloroflexota bacterium]